MGRLLAVAIAALALAGPAAAGGPKLVMGAAEDAVRQPNVVMAKTQLDLLSLAGLKAVRITSTWAPGLRAPVPGERNAIDVVADAAALTGTRVIVAGVTTATVATTPLTDGARDEFAAYTAAIARDNPTIQRLRDRQRAEPQPVLDAAVRPAGDELGSHAAYLALLDTDATTS